MEAMDRGLPMLLIPICNDQPVQAHFLAQAGAGLSLERERVTVESARSALAQLLDPRLPYRANAERVRDAYRSRDGAREAARLIAALASGS